MKKADNRKEQSRFISLRFLLLAGTLLVVCTLLFASLLGERFGITHQLTLEIVGPLQSMTARAMSSLSQFAGRFRGMDGLRRENDQLIQRNAQLLQQISEYREAFNTYRYLQEQLQFKKKDKEQFISARVIGKDPSFWLQTIILDRGRKDDVLEGMVVLTPGGVAGQIIHVSDNYSKVLLANAPSSAIDALVQKNRVRGIVKGAGDKGYTLQYVLKNADVAVGDMIITAGIGGVFSSGIPLGRVSSVDKNQRGMFLDIDIEPTVDFQKLETVLIDPTDRKQAMKELGISAER